MIDHPYKQIQLPQKISRPCVAINMVSSLDGKITSGGKLEEGILGSPFDRRTMTVIRSHFDAVLTGGNTARQHPYYLGVTPEYEQLRIKRGLRGQPLTMIMTLSGNLDPNASLFINPPRRPLIITSADGERHLAAKIKAIADLETGTVTENSEALLELLQEKYGVNSLLIEGGARINYQFLQAGLVDQLFLTLAPRLVGTDFDLTMAAGPRVLDPRPEITLLSHFVYQNELFLRYQLNWLLDKNSR